jgi:hypothetical protein
MKDNQDVSSRKLIDRLVPDPAWGPMHGLLATTYELQPDFLELDFLPSVFGLGAWDDRSWTTRIALERRLFELDAAVVFTEARRYRGRPRSLRLEVLPVAGAPGCALHAKVTVLVFDRAVRLVVGSANLTEKGYRRNREVAAVLTASPSSRKQAPILVQAISGMSVALAPWLTATAQTLLQGAQEILRPLLNGADDPDTGFIWSHAQTRLWREFLSRWPSGEPVRRISILSPFWSEDAGLTLKLLLEQLNSTGTLAADAEIRLLTDAFQEPDGRFLPVLPPGYAAFDWASLGVKATAQAVSPSIHPEEVGGMEGFTGTRALHAKILLMEGSRSGLAYLGSANFTAHGWGFLNGESATNVEAGLILRRPVQSPAFDSLLPDLAGEPVLLTGGNTGDLRPPEITPDDEPWPGFFRSALLSPVPADDSQLELLIEVLPDSAARLWSARMPNKEGIPGDILLSVENTQAAGTSFSVPLSKETLSRLLVEQEILISWTECPLGRPVPLNVAPSARARLPISPGSQRIEEDQLLSYYQGRIAWEDLFPDPDSQGGRCGDPVPPNAPDAGVDKSRIQSYQIREFVEALAGLRQDLAASAQSEPAIRLALLGPVSPIALAGTVIDAVKCRGRTPTAAAFQLVEILACLKSARSTKVPDKLAEFWCRHLDDATATISRLLQQLLSDHSAKFADNRAFHRYQKAVLNNGHMLQI